MSGDGDVVEDDDDGMGVDVLVDEVIDVVVDEVGAEAEAETEAESRYIILGIA